ncbi:MAG: hypothetical protein AAGI48_00705 [Verrucomicrobiota bacterium]
MKAVLRAAVVAIATIGVLIGLTNWVQLAPGWPLWAITLGVVLAVELILWLYRYEQAAVSPVRARWITGLRLTALGVLVWILIEPTWVRTVTREREREVVVVIDDSASMYLTDDGAESSRREIGERVLKEVGLVEALGKEMRVRTVRAARRVMSDDEEVGDGWAQATDLAEALGTVLDQVPPDEVGGVVLVSDGRHNRPARVEDVARRFGILDAPVGVVAVGSEVPPKDAAVLSLTAPEAVHLGDRMRIRAELKFDGYKGQRAKVRLLRGGELLDEREVPIPLDHHREEVRFAQMPEDGGVGDYRVEIAALEGERFDDNNGWEFETSITDARTNVLVVDGHPRWEFRYLRNLFYGRDKSVHLQWVLLHPDRVKGLSNEEVAASAARPFGDAQATMLPRGEEEWRKFDVIILGDVSPDALGEEQWRIIRDCVNERAALLVMVAGPEFMPHAISSEIGRGLVPVEVEWGARTHFNAGGVPFRIGLTAEGSGHPVVRQAAGEASNEQLWAGFPTMRWRYPLESVKEGAEVLLIAEDGDDWSVSGEAELSSKLDALAKRREREAKAALLVTRQSGKGKVAMLLTDRSWRLREGSGDVYHHRFWGNLVRWGAGPNLRAGGERVRLGTDQLRYTPDDRVGITVRLRDDELNPLAEDDVQAEILRDGVVVATIPLPVVPGSNGLHSGVAGPFGEAGRYVVKVQGEGVKSLMIDEALVDASAGFRVVGSRGPVELSETTLNLPLLQTIADLSGGRVLRPDQAGELADLFLAESSEREEVRETGLWDHWAVLVLLAALLSAEWTIRRGGGLP